MALSSEERRERSQPQWSQLQPELLEIIARKAIGNISDHIRFRSVCRAWRSVAFPHLVKLPPLLMLPYDISIDNWAFFSLSSKSFLTVSLPEVHDKMILTSSHGWLVLFDSMTAQFSMFNPVTRAQIPLPPTTDLYPGDRIFYPGFAFLSSDPDSADGDCVVIIDWNCRDIVFCRPGDEEWTVFHTDLAQLPQSILYRQGRFYLIDDQGIFYIYDANSNPSTPELICKMKAPRSGVLAFLEKTTGAELFMFVNEDFSLVETTFLTIFKLDRSKKPPEWSQVDNIGDRTLFWTMELSSSFYAAWDFPEYKANCIYFCGYYVHWPGRMEPLDHEIEVFDIMNQSFELDELDHEIEMFDIMNQLLSSGSEESPDYMTQDYMMPAMWFTPSLRNMRM